MWGVVTPVFKQEINSTLFLCDADTVAQVTLRLEQEMRTGGGWQDQMGALYPGLAIFFALKKLGILRVSAKTELKGLDVTEHGQDAYASFQFFSNT